MSGGYIGVDVFFVLSGFLITGLLLAEATRTGSLSLAGFYVRRARRILAAATLTLVSTVLAAHLLLNFVRAKQTAVESIWAAVFGANVYFAKEGTDYFAQGQPPSPVQHYWSLAVEEQFYLVWPLLFSLVFLGVRARGGRRLGRHRIRARAARILRSTMARGAQIPRGIPATRARPVAPGPWAPPAAPEPWAPPLAPGPWAPLVAQERRAPSVP